MQVPQSAPDIPPIRQVIFGRIKVCGLTEPRQARAAFKAGAVYGGLVLAPNSSRHLSYQQARAIRAAAGLQYVGVFVDDAVDAVACWARQLALEAVQLHGRKDSDYVLSLRRRLPETTEIWQAMQLAELCRQAPDRPLAPVLADRLVVEDFHAPNTRPAADARATLRALSADQRQRLILGGQLDATTAARARRLNTWALDVPAGHTMDAVFRAARNRSQPPPPGPTQRQPTR